MSKIKTVIKEYIWITAGALLVALGVYFFKFPNNFSTGGVTGISMLVAHFTTLFSPSRLVLIINMLLLIVGFIFVGKSFAFKTVYASMLMSLSLNVFEKIFPMSAPLTNEPLLELCFAVGLPALGSAILFNLSASTGGTDIVAMILKKYTSLNIGTALFIADAVIVGCTFIVFGPQTGLFAALGLVTKSSLVDSVIEGVNAQKYFFIVTTKPDEICKYINETLHKGATVWHAEGAYTHDDRSIILAVMSRGHAVSTRKAIKQIDEHAFSVISNSSEIIGKGFRSPN